MLGSAAPGTVDPVTDNPYGERPEGPQVPDEQLSLFEHTWPYGQTYPGFDSTGFYIGYPPATQPPRRRTGLRVTAAITAGVVMLSVGAWSVTEFLGSRNNHGLPSVHGLTTSSRSAMSVAHDVERSVVDIVSDDGDSGDEDAGTGMILTSDGDVLTNNHVVDGATSIEARLVTTGRTYRAVVVGTDSTDDVAVIKLVGASGLTPITAGDSTAAGHGTSVIAIGNAEGSGVTVTTGTITATGQSIVASDGEYGNEHLHGMLRTDADIISGDSGGPLTDAAGQVIGMDTAASESGSQPGFGMLSNVTSSTSGYAIPIETALSIANRILAHDASSSIVVGTPGMLGIEVARDSSAGEFGFAESTEGAEVVGVVQGDPAAAAGLSSGDVITELSGQPITSGEDLTKAMQSTHAGETVEVTWVDQSGTSHSANVVLMTGPAA